MTLSFAILIAYSILFIVARAVDRPAGARRRVLRRRAQPRARAPVCDVSRGQHRRELHRRRHVARIRRRVERLVVERIGRDRLARAGVLGRPAHVARGDGPRRSHGRRFPGAPLRPRRCAAWSRRSSGSARSPSWPPSSSASPRSSTSSPASPCCTGCVAGRARDGLVFHRGRTSEQRVGEPRAAHRHPRGLRDRRAAGDRRGRRLGRAHGGAGIRVRCVRQHRSGLGMAAAVPARSGIHRVSRAAAEGVRRARRVRGAARDCVERRGAAGVRVRAAADRRWPLVRSTRVSTNRTWRCRRSSLDAMPPAVGTLALAAVFSAEVSSADAVLFMLATSASRDLYRGFVRPSASDADVLRVARVAAVAGSLCGVGVAMIYGSVRAAVGVFYAILTVTLFVPVIGGLYCPRRRPLETDWRRSSPAYRSSASSTWRPAAAATASSPPPWRACSRAPWRLPSRGACDAVRPAVGSSPELRMTHERTIADGETTTTVFSPVHSVNSVVDYSSVRHYGFYILNKRNLRFSVPPCENSLFDVRVHLRVAPRSRLYAQSPNRTPRVCCRSSSCPMRSRRK